jgi:hypothetical protein
MEGDGGRERGREGEEEKRRERWSGQHIEYLSVKEKEGRRGRGGEVEGGERGS